MTTATNTFKPFLVESTLSMHHTNIFRVVEVSEEVGRERVERLLELLPLRFEVRKRRSSMDSDRLHEPVEVYVEGTIVSIYPSVGRIISNTSMASWQHRGVTSQIQVDNIMDTTSPGKGQLRSCIHFNPKIFGVEGWPSNDSEIEVDLHTFPKSVVDELEIPELSFSKGQVRDLLRLISRGEKLTAEHVNKWGDLIYFAVATLRAYYENPGAPVSDNVRQYYASCWRQIDAARTSQLYAAALEDLIWSITQE